MILNKKVNQLKYSASYHLILRTYKPFKGTYDQIGPVDKVSNLRPIKFYIPPEESKLEKEYREKRQKIFDYNHKYWSEQNLSFIESRREFSTRLRNKKILNEKIYGISHSAGDSVSEDINESKEMNQFYKEFLNANYQKHYKYNTVWFKLNLSLLLPAVRVFLYRMFKKNNNKFL